MFLPHPFLGLNSLHSELQTQHSQVVFHEQPLPNLSKRQGNSSSACIPNKLSTKSRCSKSLCNLRSPVQDISLPPSTGVKGEVTNHSETKTNRAQNSLMLQELTAEEKQDESTDRLPSSSICQETQTPSSSNQE